MVKMDYYQKQVAPKYKHHTKWFSMW
jgi:hypothetical protein